MRKVLIGVLGTALGLSLAACGGGGSGDGSGSGPGATPLTSFVGTTGNFAAWVDPGSGNYSVASLGSYAGKKQVLHGTVDFLTGSNLGQAAGVEIYKGSDGHIYALDLTSSSTPAAQMLSSESAATVDDTCTLSGTAVTGANSDYLGVSFTGDLQTPTHSAYFYRLPGPDGVCNTADDVIHLVRTGMSSSAAPITVSAMPLATVRTAQGGISGFVIKSGASLVLVDNNFANPVTLGSFTAPIGVAQALAVGTTQGYPTGQLYVVDGNIVYVDYAAHSVSAPLYTIPNWLPTNVEALFAASPTTEYFAIYTPAVGATPASGTIYALPADGSAAPEVIATEAGRIDSLLFPVDGTSLLWGVSAPTYAIRSLAVGSTVPTTLVTSNVNDGQFIATANTVYYQTWAQASNATTKVLTRTNTSSGIVSVTGTVLQPPLADSTFVNGGEQFPWPADTTTTQTAYETIFQVRNLSPVSLTDPTTGYTYIVDGVSGGTLVAIDATSNQVGVTLGTLPQSGTAFLSGTFRGAQHTGFLEATTYRSTTDPATRDLYLLDSEMASTFTRITNDL